jgi:pimeloyl-ACP methyl ester carboxylesterase
MLPGMEETTAPGGHARTRVARGDARIEVLVDAPAGGAAGAAAPATLVLLPSLGRGAEDFAPLLPGLLAGGLRVLRPQPRGIGGSAGPLDGLTLHDLAADVGAAVEALGAAPAFVGGHAFGNYVARTLAADRPELVRGVVLLAASIGKPPPGEVLYGPEIQEAILGSGDPALPREARLAHLRRAFFAPGNDPTGWLEGWHPEAKRAQSAATRATPPDDFFLAGAAPVLDVQAAQDTVAPRKFAGVLRAAMGDRVSTVVVEGAGHALLPERPAAVVRAILGWVAERRRAEGSAAAPG